MEFRMLILPCIGMAPVIRALRESWREINSKWKDIQICRGMGQKEFFEVLGLTEPIEIDERARGVA